MAGFDSESVNFDLERTEQAVRLCNRLLAEAEQRRERERRQRQLDAQLMAIIREEQLKEARHDQTRA